MKIKNLEINLVQYGNKKGKNIVLLHGWGQNTDVMDILGKRLEKYFYVTNIDMPGFGKSDKLEKALTIYEYEEIFEEIMTQLKIKKPILIGHSFGGRIAIIYASKKEVEKLVLLAAPFRKMIKELTLKVRILKALKKIPILNKFEDYAKSKIGSTDYKNADPIMRETLVNIVNEDLTECLRKIQEPTLLIWGTNDTAVPIEEARYAKDIMKNAGLVELENSTHYAFVERKERVVRILENFFGIEEPRRKI